MAKKAGLLKDEFDFFKPATPDLSFEKIQKIVNKGGVVAVDSEGRKLINSIRSNLGLDEIPNEKNLPSAVILAGEFKKKILKDHKPNPSPSSATGSANVCEASNLLDFVDKVKNLYVSLSNNSGDLKLPNINFSSENLNSFRTISSNIQKALSERQKFTYFKVIRNGRISKDEFPISNLDYPEESIFPKIKVGDTIQFDNTGVRNNILVKLYRHKLSKEETSDNGNQIKLDSNYIHDYIIIQKKEEEKWKIIEKKLSDGKDKAHVLKNFLEESQYKIINDALKIEGWFNSFSGQNLNTPLTALIQKVTQKVTAVNSPNKFTEVRDLIKLAQVLYDKEIKQFRMERKNVLHLMEGELNDLGLIDQYPGSNPFSP